MTEYEKNHKKILIATWLGWLFDGLDSSLYPLVASQALGELIGANNPDFGWIAAKVLAIFLFGWSLGGFLFGFLGDKIGRAKALSLSILTYAIFTGLSGLSHSWEELAVFRFLAGLGIGGEWALGVALLAESSKPEKRIMSTAFLATGFSLGYLVAVLVNLILSPFGWRWVFLFGIVPAILVFFIRRNIKEPETWSSIKQKLNNPFQIFKKEYSFKLWIAFSLGVTISLGSWGCIIFWLPIWADKILGVGLYQKSILTFTLMLTHVFGSYAAGPLLLRFKRKIVLFVSYLMCFLIACFMYSCFHTYCLIVLLLAALLGFFFGIIPGALAIYFPELFPTKIRTTAQGFCYSTGRTITALGALYSGYLVRHFSGDIGLAASLMSTVFLFGAIFSLFAPETNQDNLPV